MLQDGDIINIDVTVYLNGYHGDTSAMFYVGTPSPEAKRLCEATKEALEAAIKVGRGQPCARPGVPARALRLATGGRQVCEHAGHRPCGKPVALLSPPMRSMHTLRPCIAQICGPNVPIRDIGEAVMEVAKRHKFNVSKEFIGHGVGKVFHARPHVQHTHNRDPDRMQVRAGVGAGAGLPAKRRRGCLRIWGVWRLLSIRCGVGRDWLG